MAMEQNENPTATGAQDRSAQIVNAAYDLLAENGLEGLTIRAVLGRTGFARRAFYDNFASKDALVLAVFEQTLQLASTLFAEQVRSIADPMARLQHIVTAIVFGQMGMEGNPIEANQAPESNRRGAALSREHLRLAESHPAELQKAIQPLIDLIAQQLSNGVKAGLVRNAPVARMATLVYNLVSTTVHSELLAEESQAPNPQRRREMADEIWEFCARAIAA